MKEVSSTVLEPFVQAAQAAQALPQLLEGAGISTEDLKGRRSRIDWEQLGQVLRNADALWGRDELERLGEQYVEASIFRPIALIGKLLFESRDLFHWAYGRRSPANSQFTCIESSCAQLDESTLRVILELQKGYAPVPQFWWVALGVMQALPKVLLQPASSVQVSYEGGVAHFTIRYEQSNSFAVRVRRSLLRPFTLASAGRALKQNLEVLREQNLELQQARDGLEIRVKERTAELEDALGELARVKASKERFFANVNHELRTPLSLIKLSAERIARESEGVGGVREPLRVIGENCDILLDLVDTILLLAAADEQKLAVRLVPMDLHTLLGRIVQMWQPTIEESGITLSFHARAQCAAKVDPIAFQRIIGNLLSNAAKFTTEGGTIDVVLDATEDTARIEVRDSGVGIALEAQDAIFDRFEQDHAPVRRGARGTGLGLSITRQLAEAHGGLLDLESEVGVGSTFRVCLPLTDQVADAEGSAEALVPVKPWVIGRERLTQDWTDSPAKGRQEATILIAEDNPQMRREIANLLSERYRVLAAPDGVVALELAATHHPDLLVADLSMPRMDGYELSREFRNLQGSRLAPVIMLTARSGLDQRLAGFDAGGMDYITKPFEPEELKARVAAHLALRSSILSLLDSEKLDSLATLSTGLAHELRNPCNSIINAIHPLQRNLPPECLSPDSPSGQLLEVIETSAERLALLSRELMGLAAATTRNTIGITELVHRAAALGSESKGCEPQLNIEDSGLELVGYEALLVTALGNLIKNAQQAADHVSVHVYQDKGEIVFDVEDDGPGLSPDIRERVFQPFFTTKPPDQGRGLGLSVVKQVAEKHNGTVRFLTPPQGCVVQLRLPTPQ